MPSNGPEQFILGLQQAWRRERATARLYRALAVRETSASRRDVLTALAEVEEGHARRWAERLRDLGAAVPADRDGARERFRRWVLVRTGTDNALKRVEDAEEDDTAAYAALAQVAPTDDDRDAVTAVRRDEERHARLARQATASATAATDPQGLLDTILRRERWHKRSGGWIGQAIYGANDGLGAVFGIVSGVAGATAGGPAVLIAGLAGMLASALSMGSGAYLATKTDREVQEAEIARERREVEQNPEEEEQELALFYQLKGVPETEARALAAHLIARPDHAVQTLAGEELGLSEQSFPNPFTAAISATVSTACGAFIPIIPFFFAQGMTAIVASFAISTLAHFLIGVAKTVVTGLSPWRSGGEMTIVGLGEALITYGLGLLFGPMVG